MVQMHLKLVKMLHKNVFLYKTYEIRSISSIMYFIVHLLCNRTRKNFVVEKSIITLLRFV